MLKTDTVAAVVVTYNRIELLQECIQALRSQTFPLTAIIVVNNSSTDGTENWLLEQEDIVTITQPNKGGAFGFYTGIKAAFEKKYDWVWCMDDDGLPSDTALACLMKYADDAPCVMNALVIDKANPDNIVFKVNGFAKRSAIRENKVNNAAAFFNGTLFHRTVIETVGLPLKDLTIWGDETEYYNRILFRYGFPVFSVADSIHYHPAQYSVFYKREWDVKSDWKVYFFVRNKAFVYKSQFRNSAKSLFAYSKFLVGFFGTIAVYQKRNRWKKIKLTVRAAKDGFAKSTTTSIAESRKMLADL